MTPLRQAFHAAVVAVGLSAALPAHAEELSAIGPPTAAESEAAAAAAARAALPPPAPPVAVAPQAAKPAPAWLASRPAPKAATGKSALPSTGRMIGLALVIASLGAATLYFKRRGRGGVGAAKGLVAPKRLSVLSSTRIGPRAHAVVISVAGRQMLLGVTDSSVKRLAFIDELEEDADERERDRGHDPYRDRDRDREPARRAAQPTQARSAALAVRAASPDPAQSRSFSDLLKTAFKKREESAEVEPAVLLAAETQDVFGGKPAPTNNVRMLDVEGQAQGLLRRLSGPR